MMKKMGKLRTIVPLTDEQRQLVADNIKLPHFVISKYYSLYSNDEDIHSIACEGLMLAAQKWDENRGAFSTYATYIIRGVIHKYFQGLTRLCRNENENRATHNTLRRMSRGEEFELDVFETLPSKEDVAQETVNRIAVAKALLTLSPEQRKIIHMMYFDGMQQKDVAPFYGISPQGISYRRQCALRKLREYFEK